MLWAIQPGESHAASIEFVPPRHRFHLDIGIRFHDRTRNGGRETGSTRAEGCPGRGTRGPAHVRRGFFRRRCHGTRERGWSRATSCSARIIFRARFPRFAATLCDSDETGCLCRRSRTGCCEIRHRAARQRLHARSAWPSACGRIRTTWHFSMRVEENDAAARCAAASGNPRLCALGA